jgi:hypothetical protein
LISAFKSPGDVNRFFKDWHDLSEASRLQAIRDLRALGTLSARVAPNVEKGRFRCPVHSFDLVRACKLSSCRYHVGPREDAGVCSEEQAKAAALCKNCLINCLDRTRNGRLSASEVAVLLGMTIGEVNVASTQTVAKIRRASIREAIEKYQIPRYRYLPGHCVACEVSIIDELEMGTRPELVLVPYRYGWCSGRCKDQKPKWQFLIEREFSCHYLDALAVGYTVYKNIESLGHVFMVSNEIIRGLKKKIVAWRADHVMK